MFLSPFSQSATSSLSLELVVQQMEIRLVFPPLLLICFTASFDLLSPTLSAIFPEEAHPTATGYLPVSPNSTSAIFYAYYEAQQTQPSTPLLETPLLVWLQGGPGCSSSVGNFFELGPWMVKPYNSYRDQAPPQLVFNPGAWNRIFGLLFLDNPIGVGFSVASSPSEIPSDQHAVARHLFHALCAFFSSYPAFKSRPLYITGESYAGKYVPAIGFHILNQNSLLPAPRRMNLKGVAIGNGLTHPIAQVATHAATAYYSGLINARQKTQLEELQAEAVREVRKGNWGAATDARNNVLRWLQNATGLATLYDLRRPKPYDTRLVTALLNREEVKEALGVAKDMVWEECSSVVEAALHRDVMKSVKHMVEELVSKSRVLLYQGQFDLRDGVVSTEAWVKEMKWEGLQSFLMAERKVWKVKGKLRGYVQKWGSLANVVVGGAGHLAPADQPLSTQSMIEDWVQEKGLFGNQEESSFREQSHVLKMGRA